MRRKYTKAFRKEAVRLLCRQDYARQPERILPLDEGRGMQKAQDPPQPGCGNQDSVCRL